MVLPLEQLKARALATPGTQFVVDGDRYVVRGERLSRGGMGTTYLATRHHEGCAEEVVVKVFHASYLYQLRSDALTRHEHEHTLDTMTEIAGLVHPHVLPTYVTRRIVDNHVMISPRKSQTLYDYVRTEDASNYRRVELLCQALTGLAELHRHGFLHRDFTLRNVLVDRAGDTAFLFDFDLSLTLSRVAGRSYGEHYDGRVFGSPGHSVAPETIEPSLMDSEISERLDIFAIGAALFGLFVDSTPYGPVDDMWRMLMKISMGVVSNGVSSIEYPEPIPSVVRPVLERCLERDPRDRHASVSDVVDEVRSVMSALDSRAAQFYTTETMAVPSPAEFRLARILRHAHDPTVTEHEIRTVDGALGKYGYYLDKSLGRVKDIVAFVAEPDLALGSPGFGDANPFSKVVTARRLRDGEREQVLDAWFGTYLGVLRAVRQGPIPALYRAVYDEDSGYLFAFSEYVADARFATDIEDAVFDVQTTCELGGAIARQLAALHHKGVAHNNVSASSLLFKALPKEPSVFPAMLGLVDPSRDPSAQLSDIIQLSNLIASWSSGQVIVPVTVASIDELIAYLVSCARKPFGSEFSSDVGAHLYRVFFDQ